MSGDIPVLSTLKLSVLDASCMREDSAPAELAISTPAARGAHEPAEARLQVEVLTDPARFAGLRQEWRALQDASGAGPFTAWEWLYPWYRRAGTALQLRILTARTDSGELVGILPLGLRTIRVLGRPVRRLGFLSDASAGSDYLDVVAAPGRVSGVTQAFAETLKSSADQWDVLDLRDMDARSKTPAHIQTALGDSHDCRISHSSLCPYETLDPDEPFDQFLRRTSRRKNYLRRRRWLERQSGYRIEITREPGQLSRSLSEFFRLHRLRWNLQGGSGAISDPAAEAFHRDATWLLAERGELRLYTAWLGDQALASVYAIVRDGTFYYYQSGFDPAWSNRSVGLVLIGATFEDALSMGLREYDFLRGTEAYKSDWVSQNRSTVRLRVTGRSGAGAWLRRWEDGVGSTRATAKKLLPDAVVQKLRGLSR